MTCLGDALQQPWLGHQPPELRSKSGRGLAPCVVVHVDAPGLSDPPAAPDHRFVVGRDSLATAIREIMELLEHRKLVPPATSNIGDEEILLTKRLAELGYL